MLGKIALEEAFNLPDIAEASKEDTAIFVTDIDRYMSDVVDITGQRLQRKDQWGVGYTILSHTVPGVQGESDPASAEKMATRINNYIADKIKNHRKCYGAFATLSMHDPKQAGEELTRCVKELGFHGALLNDVQHAGPDGETLLYYDHPRYDAF